MLLVLQCTTFCPSCRTLACFWVLTAKFYKMQCFLSSSFPCNLWDISNNNFFAELFNLTQAVNCGFHN